MQRKIGVVRKHINDKSFTFMLLAKKHLKDKSCKIYTEEPLYPNCGYFVRLFYKIIADLLNLYIEVDIPSLMILYDTNCSDEITAIKRRIFAWIMSFPDEVIKALKETPKEFCLISAVLYVLVEVCYIFLNLKLIFVSYDDYCSVDRKN